LAQALGSNTHCKCKETPAFQHCSFATAFLPLHMKMCSLVLMFIACAAAVSADTNVKPDGCSAEGVVDEEHKAHKTQKTQQCGEQGASKADDESLIQTGHLVFKSKPSAVYTNTLKFVSFTGDKHADGTITPGPETAKCKTKYPSLVDANVTTKAPTGDKGTANSKLLGEDVMLFTLGIGGRKAFGAKKVPQQLAELGIIRILFSVTDNGENPKTVVMARPPEQDDQVQSCLFASTDEFFV